MVSYPKTLPTDAAMILVGVATNGFAPDGEHGDAACCLQAAWNLLGFGFSVWLPHDHPDLNGAKIKTAALAPPSLPRTQATQLKALAGLLGPVVAKRAKGVAVPDMAALPWAQIIALAIAIIQSLLKK